MEHLANRKQAMQVDQATWDKYDKGWVKRALFDPMQYSRFRENKLKELRGLLDDHQREQRPDLAQVCQKQIHWIEEFTPPGPVFPPSEPAGLEPITYYQVEFLKTFLATNPDTHDSNKANIAAVKAYRSGDLSPQPNVTTYWYAGVQKGDPGPPGNRSKALSEWENQHGKSALWIEKVSLDIIPYIRQ
ncbi:hypothetical protein VTN77DRAFT_4320 [Rasamsonia byssochlamydoides]|uniref:uncharacterized protein n=1 Tax=Rasamsonia byssochlamydoides TaxID=89139 RepID=UPI00374269F1